MLKFEESQCFLQKRINRFDLCRGKAIGNSLVDGTDGPRECFSLIYPVPPSILEDQPRRISADRKLAGALLNSSDLVVVQAEAKNGAGHLTFPPMREGKAAEQHKVYTPCILRKNKPDTGSYWAGRWGCQAR